MLFEGGAGEIVRRKLRTWHREQVEAGGHCTCRTRLLALNTPFSAGVILPDYLEGLARDYLRAFGCVDFYVMGHVRGAPNVTVILDATAVADQEYDTLLREEKTVRAISCRFCRHGLPGHLNLPGEL